MNIQECDLLNEISRKPYLNQRILSEITGYSLGKVNQSMNSLLKEGYLNEDNSLNAKAFIEFAKKKPQNAIILAAGFGMRMIPINKETPKGLLKVNDELLIERIINQLHEVDIYEIDIVVGFMKEKYEYLIDKYKINLVCNMEYSLKNNIHSLRLLTGKLRNTYIIPCDIWCKENPFSSKELYSWYMMNEINDDDSCVRINRKMELVSVKKEQKGNTMIGIAYILEEQAKELVTNIEKMCMDKSFDNSFWEEGLFKNDKMIVNARIVSTRDAFEINTYEQLRELDEHSEQLDSRVINLIANIFKVKKTDIINISVLKKGMTNRSFVFQCKGKKYIMRIPGDGTDKMINRREENNVYQVLKGSDFCDNVIYINPENGYKITEFWEQANVCDPSDFNMVNLCMKKLRRLHESKLEVKHSFNLFGQIEYYESLWNDEESIYNDYKTTKTNIYKLKEYIDKQKKECVLSHIDAVPDNFLFVDGEVKLIDWEYSGMQDPHIDIAMFAIYSLYDRKSVKRLMDLYFSEGCDKFVETKIYCYIAVCGLLWSNWCEYKRILGIEFGEYSLRQYRYAKDYYKIAIEEIDKENQL